MNPWAISGCRKTPKEKLACPLSKRFDLFISNFENIGKYWGKIAWQKREATGISIIHPRKAKKIYKYSFE